MLVSVTVWGALVTLMFTSPKSIAVPVVCSEAASLPATRNLSVLPRTLAAASRTSKPLNAPAAPAGTYVPPTIRCSVSGSPRYPAGAAGATFGFHRGKDAAIGAASAPENGVEPMSVVPGFGAMSPEASVVCVTGPYGVTNV